MTQMAGSPQFQEVIEAVEALPAEDQAVLIDVIRQRLAEKERARLAADVAESRTSFQEGAVRRGTAADLLAEIDE